MEGCLRGILESLWEHLWHMGVTLGSLWDYFGVSLGLVSVADFASLDGHFAIIVESFSVCKGPFPKNTHFPDRI